MNLQDVNLVGKQICSVGLKNSGKSNFIKYAIMQQYSQNHLVFDPNDEYKDKWNFNQYVPGSKRSNAELDLCIDKILQPRLHDPFDLFVVDESNRFHSKGGSLGGPIGELIDWGTSHQNIGAWFVARRPKSLHSDVLELSDYIFVHKLTGQNDLKKLQNINKDLPDEVKKISGPQGNGKYPQYSCIMVTPGRQLVPLAPCREMPNDKPTS